MYNKKSVYLILILSICGIVWCFTSDDLRVTLPNGSRLVGRYLRSYNGRPIKAFMSIPYAKPPIGQLRFRAPEPLDKWDGEFKAINEGVKCSQRDPFVRSYEDVGSEDCLNLNVYVPHTYEEKKPDLPVMVFYHGGGFMCGSGIRSSSGPEHFLDEDVILATANYRLGPLGFLSTEDENCPGNFGLKDQVLVLKWIQKNIEEFGGDRDSVTIFGGSAGGASVTYLMASPLAIGLFSKAIAQSGTNLAPWSQPAHKGVAKKRAKQLAKYFSCYKSNDWSHTIDCLRNVPAVNITAAFYEFFEFDMDPMVPFSPVVEPDLPGAFLTQHPREAVTEHSIKIPFLTGITFDEGLMKSAPFFNLPGLFDKFADNLDYVLPIAFYYDHHEQSQQNSITNRIKQFYFNNNLTRDAKKNVTNLFGDGWFLNAMDSYLRMRLSHKEVSSTYVYLLTHKAAVSFTELFHGDPDTFYGVSHADEQLYLFPSRDRFFPFTLPTKEDEKVRKTMIKLWVNFARAGNPTPDANLPKWDSVKSFPINYYRIGNLNFENKPIFGMENGGLFEDRATFWRDISAFSPSHYSEKDEF